MDDDRDLRNFSGTTRLFPLPRVVLFPHAVLPLHIFEPRYRQMTEDALKDDRLITIVQVVPPHDCLGAPPIEPVGCLGRILQHERLEDGRFNLLLLGRRRVRLAREVPRGKLYRVAEAEILEDIEDEPPGAAEHRELAELFRKVFEMHHKLDPDLAAIVANPLPAGVLTDIVAHALGLPAEFKQQLLAEPSVGRRAEALLSVLRRMIAAGAGRSFPPRFSEN